MPKINEKKDRKERNDSTGIISVNIYKSWYNVYHTGNPVRRWNMPIKCDEGKDGNYP